MTQCHRTDTSLPPQESLLGQLGRFDLVTANPPYIQPEDRVEFQRVEHLSLHYCSISDFPRFSCQVSQHTGSQKRTPDLQGKKLPEHSQRRFCYYELRGGINEFASAASKMLKSDGKFCNFAALDAAGKLHKLDCQQGHF